MAVVRCLGLYPQLVMVLAVALLIGGCWGGLWGLVVVLATTTGAAFGAVRSRRVQRRAAERLAAEERRQRSAARLRRIEVHAAERAKALGELSRIVDQLEDEGAEELVARLGLHELLDRYVELAIAQARCQDSIRRSELRLAGYSDTLVRIVDDEERSLRRAINERRSRHRDECRRRVARLELHLEAISDLIQLVDQRAASPELDDEIDEEIAWRLADVDELEAARRELAAVASLVAHEPRA
jgi:hypothetical protein